MRRKTLVLRCRRSGAFLPRLRHNTAVLRHAKVVYAVVDSCIVGTEVLAPLSCDTRSWFALQAGGWQGKIWSQMALEHELPWIKSSLCSDSCDHPSNTGCWELFTYMHIRVWPGAMLSGDTCVHVLDGVRNQSEYVWLVNRAKSLQTICLCNSIENQ